MASPRSRPTANYPGRPDHQLQGPPGRHTAMAPSPGDVRQFDRFARFYDWVVPSADAAVLEAGLALADGDVGRVLDVGGGTGRASRALSVPERVVVDASAGMLREARRRGLHAVRADAAALPVQDGAVDAALVVDSLHHVADREAAVREAARAVRPGGVVVVQEFDPTTVLGRLLAAWEHLVGFDSTFDPPAALREVLAAAGLEVTTLDEGFSYALAGVRER